MKRWLPIVACVFAALPCGAQRMAPVGVDLFGDDIVKPIEASRRGIVRVTKPAASEKVADPFGHVLFFADGRQLRGELVELGQAEIVWKRADVAMPMRFPRKAIRRIELREGKPSSSPSFGIAVPRRADSPADTNPAAVMPATVKLPGSDWLHGDVRTDDGENFTLELKNGADLKFSRSQVEWIYFNKHPVPAFGFSGELLSMEGWIRGNPTTEMDVHGGLFRLTGPGWIGRELAPPPRFEVDFILPQHEGNQATRLWIQPYRPSPNSYSTGTIELSFGQKELGRLIYINQFKRETSPMPADNAEGKNRYRVFYDGIGHQLSVTRNGELLGQWSLLGDPPNEAHHRNIAPKGICFDRGHGNQNLVLGALRVQPWDGVIPKKDAPDEERVVIGKEPARTGRLERIGPYKFSVGGVESDRAEGTFVNLAQRPQGIADASALLLFGNEGELAAANLEIRDGVAKARTSLGAALEIPAEVLETIAFGAAVPANALEGDTLVFRNGDTLRGKILKAGSGGAVQFEHDGQVSEIQPANIAGMRLAKVGAPKLAGGASLELCNGDRFRGELIALETDAVRFRHGDFGEKSFPRGKLRRLYPAASSLVVDAAADPEAWLGLREARGNLFAMGRKPSMPVLERVFLDGVFLQAQQTGSSWSAGGLAYHLEKPPERYEFRCEVADAGGAEPYINLTLAGNNGSPSLQTSLGGGQLRFYAYNVQRARGGAVFQQNREVPLEGKFAEQFSRREVRLFVDTKVGTVDIVLDGVHLAKFGQQPAERAPGIGAQITLSAYGYSSSATVVSNVSITPWNGDLALGGEGNGSVSLVNGDFTEGPVGGIQDGKLIAGVDDDSLEIPLDRILCVDFGGAAVAEKPAARVRLRDGAVVHFAAFEFDRETLSGESVTLGPVKVPAGSIAEVVLSPAPLRFPKNAPPKKLVSKEAEPPAENPAP